MTAQSAIKTATLVILIMGAFVIPGTVINGQRREQQGMRAPTGRSLLSSITIEERLSDVRTSAQQTMQMEIAALKQEDQAAAAGAKSAKAETAAPAQPDAAAAASTASPASDSDLEDLDDEAEDDEGQAFDFHSLFVALHMQQGGRSTQHFVDADAEAEAQKAATIQLAAPQDELHEAVADAVTEEASTEIPVASNTHAHLVMGVHLPKPQQTPSQEAWSCLEPILDSSDSACKHLAQAKAASKPLFRAVHKSFMYKKDLVKRGMLAGLHRIMDHVETTRKQLRTLLKCHGTKQGSSCVDTTYGMLSGAKRTCRLVSEMTAHAQQLEFVVAHSGYLKTKFPAALQLSSTLKSVFAALSSQLRCGVCF